MTNLDTLIDAVTDAIEPLYDVDLHPLTDNELRAAARGLTQCRQRIEAIRSDVRDRRADLERTR